MRILLAGATGVLGRSTLPHLRGHRVAGLTRSPRKLPLLDELGADGVVCDVFDHDALLRVAERVRPDTVVNFVTDLAGGSSEANARARRVGGPNLLAAAVAVGASRLVVESVAFPLEGEGAQAVDGLERSAQTFAGEALVLRFGRLWGPDTFHQARPQPPAMHVDDAGPRAAALIIAGAPGAYEISDESSE